MPPRRYLASLLAISSVTLGWIVALNVALDSDGVLTALDIKRSKPGELEILHGSRGWYPVSTGNRDGKALNVRWYKPDAVALGSSDIASYFDTEHPALRRWSERPAYNFGFAGATAFELEEALRHVTALRKPRLAVVALEFYMFGARRWSNASWTLETFPMAYRSTYRTELIKLAIPRMLSWSGPVTKLKELVRHVSAAELEEQAAARRRLHDVDRTQIAALYEPGTPYVFTDTNGRSSIDALRRLIAFARQNRIELRMMVSPHHVRHYEIIRALGLWPRYLEWLRELATVADTANSVSACEERLEILNFGEYRPFNIDLNFRTGSQRAIFERFDDSFHYNQASSFLLMGELLARDPCAPSVGGLAAALTPASVEAHIVEAEEERAAFAAAHPDEIADVASLVAGFTRR
jgi:hypothetical protein